MSPRRSVHVTSKCVKTLATVNQSASHVDCCSLYLSRQTILGGLYSLFPISVQCKQHRNVSNIMLDYFDLAVSTAFSVYRGQPELYT